MCCQDDEISSTAEMVQKLQEQIAEQEELIAALQRDCEQAQAEAQRQQSLSEASMNEVKEVLQALEELALSYEQKTQEVLSKDRDNEALTEELTRKTVTVLLADRTVGRTFGTLCRMSVCLSVICLSVVCLSVCDVLYPGKTAGQICMKFSGKVWTDRGTT